MKNVLAVCNTPLQIISVLNLKRTRYKNDKVDIILSDHMNDGPLFVQNILKQKIFNNAFFVETFEYTRRYPLSEEGRKSTRSQRIIKLLSERKRIVEEVEKFIRLDKKYDVLLVSNLDRFSQLLYKALRIKHHLKVFLFEDGFSSYMAQENEWKSGADQDRDFKSIIRRLLSRTRSLNLNISGQYVYRPELVRWKAPFKRFKMELINKNDKDFIKESNRLFGYDPDTKPISEPIIFFEESFRREGRDLGDLDLVKAISGIVGKENILIKHHPRVTDAVYEKSGFKIMGSSSVPWEVILLNDQDITKKTLISVGSGAVATPFTMFGIITRSVVLIDLVNYRFNDFYSKYFDYMREFVFYPNPEVFFCPKTEEELIAYFSNRKNSSS